MLLASRTSQKERQLLGYVLSGARSSEALFEPLVEAEDVVREGMLVVIESKSRRLLGTVARIRAHHELFEPGSLWAESIRRNQLPPRDVARRYLVATVLIYGVLRSRGLGTSDRPPEPGSPVYEALPKDLEPLYGYTPGMELPENIVEIGWLYGYEGGEARLPASLDLDRLPMHMAVLGVTGSGKSNTVGVILEKLGRKRRVAVGSFHARTIPAFVFDANGDYLDYYEMPNLVPSYHVVRLVFSNAVDSIANVDGSDLMELRLDLNMFQNSPSELAEAIYAAVRGGGVEGVELQLNLLTRIFDTLVSGGEHSYGDDLGSLIEEIRVRCSGGRNGVDLNMLFRLQGCINYLIEAVNATDEHRATKGAVIRTLRSFHELVARRYDILAVAGQGAFDERFVDGSTEPHNPSLVIIDFSPDGAPGVDLRLKQFVVYYVARLLLNRFVYYKTRGEPRVAMLVVEEAQNYIPNQREYPVGYSVARGYLALAATQGRKFGLSLVLVTQRPGFVDPVVLSMMNTFIVHRVASGDKRFVQVATGGLPDYIASRLPLLETGVAVITGQMSSFPYPVLARIERRRRHAAGRV